VTVGIAALLLVGVAAVALTVLSQSERSPAAQPTAPPPSTPLTSSPSPSPTTATTTTATSTTSTTTTPPPVSLEGEGYQDAAGVQPAYKDQASGGATMGYIEEGDWAAYPGVPLTVPLTVTARVSSASNGGTIEFRDGAALGPLLGTVQVPGTGDWASFTTVSTVLSPGSSDTLVLRFTGGPGYLLDVDSFEVVATG
jgi:cytoskeletal protein RodZ